MKLRLHVPHPVKQIALIITSMLFMLFVARADEPAVFKSIKVGDTVVNNVRVKEATPTYLIITFDGGGSKLDRKHLPSDLKGLYPYDAGEAAAYEKQQATEQAERDKKARIRQDETNRQLKINLQHQQQATRGRIDQLQKELAQLEKEMGPMKGKARGKPHSTARLELDAARDRQQDLIRRIGEQKTLLDKINKQLDVMP